MPKRDSGLKYSMSVMEDNAPANGFSENSVLLRVSEPDDAPRAGLPLAFSADNGAVVLVRDVVTNHYGVVQVGVVRPHGPEADAQRLDLLPVVAAGGDNGLMPSCLEAEGNCDVGVQVAQRAEGRQDDPPPLDAGSRLGWAAALS